MGLDLEKSFKYMFKDPDWKKKFLIGGLFSIGLVLTNLGQLANNIPDSYYESVFKQMPTEQVLGVLILLCLAFLLMSVLSVFTSGYFAKNINLRIFRPDAELLPWNNFGNMFAVGVKASFAIFIYILFLLLLIVIPFVVAAIIAMTGNKAFAAFIMLISIVYVLAMCFVFIIYLAAGTLAFSTDLKFSSYFNFKLIHTFIKKDFLNFFIYLVILFALNSLIGILNTVLALTIVGIIALPFTTYYQYLVANDIQAQFVRETLEIDKRNIQG